MTALVKGAEMSLRIVIVCAICLMLLSIANADSVSLPLNAIKKPSNDLVARTGDAMDASQAAALAGKGEDLSILNPVENKMWQNRTYPAVEETAGYYHPQAAKGVQFLSEEAALPFTYMSRVQSRENPGMFYRMSLSRYSHTMLMRAALLRKLGYYVPSPKYYSRLKVFFVDEETKESYLANAQESMISDFESRDWIAENNVKDHSVTFADVVLEPALSEYFDVQWGYAPDPNHPDQLPAVQRYSRYRAYRALIVPFSLVDVPESINRYSAKFGSVLSGHVVLNHPSAQSFAACTYEDARWLVRRLAQLQEKDFSEIVAAGAFPKEIEPLVLAKLLHRVHNALELFDLTKELRFNLPSLQINSPSGIVKNGKVTQEFVPGYPQRFAHGERQSPFQDGDLQRHLGIRGKTAAIGTALNHINQKLDLLKISDLYAGRRDQISNRIAEHIRNKPMEPLYQQVEAWGGPVGGLNIGAARHVTTGTYYGSSAPIQLVDNMSVSARLGYFMAVDGIPKVSPMAGANVMVMRDYTHVRPLLSIQEGSKVPWKDLLIPGFMKKVSEVLESEKEPVGKEGAQRDSLDAFLADLREGEVFTVTDSIVLSTYGQLSSSLDVLLGIAPLNFLTSASLGVDANRITLRQTNFVRTREGLQVYVRAQKGSVLGATVDVNYFINVLRIRSMTNATDIQTDAFIINYNPEYADLIDSNQTNQKFVKEFLETRKNLKPVLRSLFKSNDPELLYANFAHRKFEVDHELKTKEVRSKFLAMRVNKFQEDHLLRIRYPENPEAPHLNPKDEEVTLFAHKRGELKGRDLLGFATDWIEGILNKFAPRSRVDLARTEDPNPANTPFGRAHWKLVTTEADLTVNGKQYPSVANLQKVWGGWHLSRNKFFKLLDEVQGELKNTPVGSYRLIEKEAFANVDSVDFYRITAHWSLLPGGLDRLRALVLQPHYDGKPVPRARFLSGVFQKLSEKMGRPARANDMAMFNDIIKILGKGNFDVGQQVFLGMCQDEDQKRNGSEAGPSQNTATWLHGTNYDCMVNWMKSLIDLSGSYPKDKKAQTQWMTQVLYILEEQIPLPQLLNYVGKENFVYFVRINGFRAGDEDGDLEFFSNTLGDPAENLDYAGGLINMFSTKTGISPIELDRSQGSFR